MTGEMKNAYRILIGRLLGNPILGRATKREVILTWVLGKRAVK
jgi:hypothetical protein